MTGVLRHEQPRPPPAARAPWHPLERLKVGLSVRFGWRLPGRLAQAVRGFQSTEADGVWHLHHGLRRLTDARQRASVFLHALEEESHADRFVSVYERVSDDVFVPEHFEREPLAAGPVWKTFAYVHVGEEEATTRFRLIRDATAPGPLKDALGKIVGDEEGHVDLTHQMLLKLGATEAQIRREVLAIRLRRAWERWLRVGKRSADFVATVLLSALYYLTGPFVFLAARRRLRQRVVSYDNNHLKRL